MSEDVLQIVLNKLNSIEKKVEKTHNRLFQSNGNRALVDVVADNTNKIDNFTKEERGKILRYITNAGKIAASISAIGSLIVIIAFVIVKLTV